MTDICAICGRLARYTDEPTGFRVCGLHVRFANRDAPLPVSFARDQHARRLVWFHGAERAAVILAGADEEANADIERWRRLG